MTPDHVKEARLTAPCDGRALTVPVRCYAISPPYVYVHVPLPADVDHLRLGARVLLAVDDEDVLAPRCPCQGWGTLEEAPEEELAPHVGRITGTAHRARIWRVRLDSLGTDVTANASGAGAIKNTAGRMGGGPTG
jgi:hypothetical protein